MQKRDSRNASRTNQNNIGRKSRRGKKAAVAVSAAIGALGVFGATQHAHAGTISKTSNLGLLNSTADWNPAQVPTSGDLAVFSNSYTPPNNFTTLLLGASQSWGGIKIVNPGGDVIIGPTPGLNLTLGGTGAAINDGIDMSTSTVNATISAALILGGLQSWNVDAGHVLTLSGNISDQGNFIQNPGAGTVLVTGTIGGSGTFTESTGILQIGSSGALSGIDLNQTGGSLQFVQVNGTNAVSTSIGSIDGTSNIGLTNTAGFGVNLTVGGDGNNTTYTGILSGTGSLIFGGNTNTMVLTQNNTYTSPTTISGGTLQLGNGGITGSLGTSTGAIVDNGTLVYNLNKNITIGNVISGGGSLTTNLLNHTMLLTAANTFSGVMTIGTGDTLFLGNANAIGAANLNYGDGNTLNFGTLTSATIGALTSNGNPLDTITVPGGNFVLTLGNASNSNDNIYSATLAGGSATATLKIADNANGIVQIAGPNTFTGTLNIASGTLEFGNGGTTGWSSNAPSGTITDSGTLVFDMTVPVTVNNVISNGTPNIVGTITTGLLTGIGSLTISSASTVTLTASNSFTGTTIINGGFTNSLLQLGNVNALAGSNLNYNNQGGNLSFGTLTAAVFGALSGGQSLSLNNTNAVGVALSIGNTGTLNTYTGVFSGAGSINKIGTGIEVLTSTGSTYTGGTTITSGQLTITNGSSLGAPASGVLASILSNATLSTSAAGSFTTADGLFLTGNTALTLQGSTMTIGGNVNSVTGGKLFLQGGGTLRLTGANPTFTDVLVVGNSGFSAGSPSATLEVGDGVSGSIASMGTMGGQQLTDNGTVTFDLPTSTNAYTMTNIINGTGNLSQIGASSTLNLTGANSYTGNTTVTNGILQLGNASALGTGTSNGQLTVNNPGTLDMHGFSQTVGGLNGSGIVDNLSASPVTLTVGNNNNFSSTFGGVLQNSTAAVSIIVQGTGTFALTGSNTYSGNTTISTGTLRVNNFANTSNNGQVGTIGVGSLGNTSGVTIGNAALEVLGNAFTNNYTTAIPLTLSGTSSAIQVDNLGGQAAASFEITGNIADGSVSGSLVVGGGSLATTPAGVGTLVLAGTSSYTGTTTIAGSKDQVGVSATLQIGDGVGGSLASLGTGAITDNGTLSFNLPQTGVTLAALISGSGQLIQNSTNTLTLSGNNNTYTGDTIVQAGTLLLGNQLALQNSALNYNNQGGVFSFGTLTSAAFGGLAGSQNLGLTNAASGAVALTIGTNNVDRSYTGNLSDGGTGASINKVGIANTTLGGTNSYTGGTTVNEGNLEFVSSSAFGSAVAGSIMVNSGGTVSLDTGVGGLVTGGAGRVNTGSVGALGLASVDSNTNINFTTLPFSAYANMSLGANTGNVTYTGTITPAGGNYRLGGGNTLTLPNAQLTGANGVIVENGGNVILNGLNTYTGAVQILGSYPNVGGLTTVTPYVDGQLSIGSVNNGSSSSPLGSSSNVASNLVINGGDLVFIGASDVTDRLFTVGSGGATLTSSGTGPITFTNFGAITQLNAGTQSINGTSNITGTTITGLNTAFLTVGMTVSDSLSNLPGGTSIVSITGNTVVINNSGASAGGADTITFGNQSRNLVLNGNVSGNVIDGALSDPAGGKLTVVESSGNWILGGTNTYSGTTELLGGELGFTSSAAVSPSTTLNFKGGLLQITGAGAQTLPAALNQTTFNGGFDITNPAGILTLNVALSGTGSLIKTGAGTLALTAANVYTGTTTINEGTLNLNSSGGTVLALGSVSTPVTLGGGTLLFTGGTSTLTEFLKNTTLASGSSTISVSPDVSNSNTNLNLGQLIPLTGATAQFTTGTNSTISYASIVSGGFGTGGIITTALGAPIGVIGSNWAAGVVSTNSTITPLLSYFSPNSGTSALGANGNYDIINSGEMRASSNETVQSIRFNTPLGGYYIGSNIGYPVFSAAAGATILNNSVNRYDQLYVKSSTVTSVGGFLMTANTGTNNVYINTDNGSLANSALNGTAYRSLSATAGNEITFIQQNTVAGMYLLTGIDNRGGTAVTPGVTEVFGGTSIVKDGAGTVYSSPYQPIANTMQNFWSGPTYINGGTWAIADDTGLGGVSTTAQQMMNPVIINGGTLEAMGTFQLNTGGAGSNDRPVQLGANGGGIDVTSNNGIANVFTITGVISGTGALNKTDTGTLLLSANNTYTGGTNINGGSLQVDTSNGKATGTGSVNINSGGALIGVGTVNTQVNINNGGILAPGDPGINLGVGTFTVGRLSVNSGGAATLDEVGGSDHRDIVNVSNALSFATGGGVNLNLQGTSNPFNSAGTYTLFTVNGSVAGNIFATTTVPTGGLDSGATTSSLINLNGILNATYTIGTVVNAGVTSVQVTINGGSTSGIWNSTGSGAAGGWNNAANWLGQIPTGDGAAASFLTTPGITSPSTIQLGANQTAGYMVFNNTNGYTLSGTTGNATLALSYGTAVATVLDNLGNQTISAPVVLNSNAAMEVISPNSTDTLTFSGPITSQGVSTTGINIQGTGTVVLSGNNTYAGATTISAVAATLQIGAGGATGTLGTNTGLMTDNGTLAFDVTGNTVLNNQISGQGNLTQNSPVGSDLLVNGTNYYSGNTSILSGTLSLGCPAQQIIVNSVATNASSLGSNANIIFGANGTLDINGQNITLGNISGTGGTIDNLTAGGAPTVIIGSLNTNTTWGGVITNSSGSINVTKQGSGVITFTNTNSYTGVTTVNAGAILAAVTNAISPNSTITTTNINDGLILGPGVTLSSTFNIGTNNVAELMDVPTGNAVYAGNINNPGAGGAQYRMGISGSGSLTLTGNTVQGGQLFFDTKGNIVYGGTATIVSRGGWGFGRSTGFGVQVLLENNASLNFGGGVSSGNGVAQNFMNLYIQDQASANITGGFDLENSTLTSSSAVITLNGGTLSTSFFSQTQNPNSPGLAQGGNTSLPNGIVDGTYMFLNGGVLTQTTQVGTNAFLPTINDLSIFVQPGGAKFNSNGLTQIVRTPMQGPGAFNGGDGGVQKLGLGTTILSGLNPAFGLSGGTESNYLGQTVVKGGLLELQDPAALGGFATNGGNGNTDLKYDQISAMVTANLSLGYTPSVTVNVGGAAGFEGGTISGSNNSNYFISTLEQSNTGGSAQINLGGLALDGNSLTTNGFTSDAAQNIDYTHVAVGGGGQTNYFTSGGAFSMDNASLVNMSIGALSAGITYTGTITPGGAGYLLGGGGTLTMGNANALTGANNVTIENGGTVALPNTNNYSGTTTIKGSYIMADPSFVTQPFQSTVASVSVLSNGGVGDSLGTASNAASNLVLDGGTLQFVGSTTGTTNKLFTITSAGGTLDASGFQAPVGTNAPLPQPLVFVNTGADVSTDAGTQVGSVTVGKSQGTGLVTLPATVLTGVDTHGLSVGGTVSDSLGKFSNATIVGLTPNSITLAGTTTYTPASGDTFTFNFQPRNLTLTGSSTGEIDSTLQDGQALSVTKNGTGTWKLAGTNTYSGGTTLNAGTLQINTNASMGSNVGTATLNGGILEVLSSITTARNFITGTAAPTIQLDGGDTYEIDGTIVNGQTTATALAAAGTIIGGLNLSGTGAVILTGSNSYTGTTVIGSGVTLTLGNGGGSGQVVGNIVDNNVLNFNRNDTGLTLAGTISGSGTVNQNGSGSTTLTGGNNYTGLTTISAGALNVNSVAAIPYSPVTGAGNVLNNAIFNINAGTVMGNLTGTGTTNVATDTVFQPQTLFQTALVNNGHTNILAIGGGTVGSVSGTGDLTINATGAQFLDSGGLNQGAFANNGNTTIQGGPSVIGGIAQTPALSGTGTLSVTGTNNIKLALRQNTPAGSWSLTPGSSQGSITLSPNVQLDITDNPVVLTGLASAAAANSQYGWAGYIGTGYAGAAFTGKGIMSSQVAAKNAAHTNTHLFAVAYAWTGDTVMVNAKVPGTTNTYGATYGTAAFVIQPALVGDANMDGVVNYTDFQIFSANVNTLNTNWDQANFNDGPKTAYIDFQLLSANLNSSTSLDNAQFTSMENYALANGQTMTPNADGIGFTLSNVPEPASLTLIGGTMAALGFIRPRRRKNKAENQGGATA